MSLYARILKPEEERAWDDLARTHGSLFNTLDWTAQFGPRLVRCGLFNKAHQLDGGFCYYRDTRLGLTFVRQAPYTPDCGPFVVRRATNPVSQMEETRDAVEAMAAYFDRIPWAVVTLTLSRTIGEALPFHWRKYKVIPGYTYILDLQRPWADIQQNMSATRRNDIKKAEKDGIEAIAVSDPQTVFDLVRNSFGRQEKRLDEAILRTVLFEHARPDASFAFVAMQDGAPAACCFCVHDSRTAFYLLGGYRAEKSHHGAGALALGRAIAHARDLGLESFDFEGSIVPAIERYFRGFGGRFAPYLTVNKAWLPLEMALKMVKRNVF